MPATDDLHCADRQKLAENMVFITGNYAKSVISVSGCVLFVVVYHRQRLTTLFHPNARLILKFHIFFLFCSIFGTVFGDGFNAVLFTVFRWVSENENCPGFLLSPYLLIIKLIKLFGFDGSAYTSTAWALERIYATVFLNSYESKTSCLGWALCGLATVVVTGSTVIRGLLCDYSKPMLAIMLPGKSYKFSMMVTNVSTFLEFFNVFIFLILLLVNQYRLRKTARIECSLASKYQIRENVEATSLIFPLALLHCIFYLPASVIMPIITKDAGDVEKVILFANAEWMSIYIVALSLLLCWRNGVKRNAVESLVRNNLIGEKYANDRREGRVDTAKYFEMFNMMLK